MKGNTELAAVLVRRWLKVTLVETLFRISDYMGGLCTDEPGDVYACDTQNDLIAKFSSQGALVANYNDLDLRNPTLVTLNRQYLVVVTEQNILSCVLKVFRMGTAVRTTQL